MRPPSVDDLAAEPILGALAVIELALIVLARTLRISHPDVDRVPRPSDAADTAAARQLVDDCDVLLNSLDHYRHCLSDRRRASSAEPDWPF
jgi:hypothetical protein